MQIIEVNHVTKEFQLGQLSGLKHTALDAIARLRGHRVPKRAAFKALDDIAFNVESGEVLGIIGDNGAGKSTLLKLLAHISAPTRGTVAVKGKVAPLIEIGAGLIPDLTGRENIYLNGCILGMKRAEIARKFDDIVAFAELADFIDTPVKRYSSGMLVRLGFSLATSVDADILIVDEVLAVGDLAFQRKCFDRMEEMIRRKGKTVLVVSHNIRQVERLCNRVLLLDQGRIIEDGPPSKVCNLFYTRSDRKIQEQTSRQRRDQNDSLSSGDVELASVHVLDSDGLPTNKVTYGADVVISVLCRVRNTLQYPNFGIGIHTIDSLYLATQNSAERARAPEILIAGMYRIDYAIKALPFLPGSYSLRVGVQTGGGVSAPVFYAENLAPFRVEDEAITRAAASDTGFIALNGSWNITAVEMETKTRTMADRSGSQDANEPDAEASTEARFRDVGR
jgi:lipopolysaccharide transport system ATP-binding protein